MTHHAAPSPCSDIIVCLKCDAAYALSSPGKGEQAVCKRCETVLISPRHRAGKQIIALSLAILILLTAAAIFPFLSVHVIGASNSISVLQTALAFDDGPLVVLVLVVVCLIFVIPLLRVLLAIYVLVPLVADRPPAPHAAYAFRLSEDLRPWAMAEIFAIGCAVALIKISALAEVSFGPAFWMFGALVVLVVVQDNIVCRWSVWNALKNSRRS